MALSTSEYKRVFLASPEAAVIRVQLEAMVTNPGYNTRTFYTPADDEVSFADKHLNYLSEHPKLKASEYLANLRLMTKNRLP